MFVRELSAERGRSEGKEDSSQSEVPAPGVGFLEETVDDPEEEEDEVFWTARGRLIGNSGEGSRDRGFENEGEPAATAVGTRENGEKRGDGEGRGQSRIASDGLGVESGLGERRRVENR